MGFSDLTPRMTSEENGIANTLPLICPNWTMSVIQPTGETHRVLVLDTAADSGRERTGAITMNKDGGALFKLIKMNLINMVRTIIQDRSPKTVCHIWWMAMVEIPAFDL